MAHDHVAAGETFTVGDRVQVHAFGHWYWGTLVKIGRTSGHVEYTTGSGASHVKAVRFDSNLLRSEAAAKLKVS